MLAIGLHSQFPLYLWTGSKVFDSLRNKIRPHHSFANTSTFILKRFNFILSFPLFSLVCTFTCGASCTNSSGNCLVLEMSGVLLWVSSGPKENINSLVSFSCRSGGGGERTQKRFSGISFASGASAFSSAVAAETLRSSEERVYEVVLKQAALVKENKRGTKIALDLDKDVEADFNNVDLLNAAYDRCGEVCAEYAKTFYLGTCLSFDLSLISFIISVSN